MLSYKFSNIRVIMKLESNNICSLALQKKFNIDESIRKALKALKKSLFRIQKCSGFINMQLLSNSISSTRTLSSESASFLEAICCHLVTRT